jgi:hypothetical protein
MLNNNSFKTSLLFLGIIFIVIIARMFAAEDTIFVNQPTEQTASIPCTLKSNPNPPC